MPNVVTPFLRKRGADRHKTEAAPRHRREGHFDDKDVWHDSEAAESTTHHAEG